MVKKFGLGLVSLLAVTTGVSAKDFKSVSTKFKGYVPPVCELTQSSIDDPASPSLIPIKEFTVRNNDPRGVEFAVEHQEGKFINYRLIIMRINKGLTETKKISLSSQTCFSETIQGDEAITDLKYKFFLEPVDNADASVNETDVFNVRLTDSSMSQTAVMNVSLAKN